uniref:Uncharacterized protein n=1 Tax=Megaselia scalaris TaxID=36166 RepID=T1GRT9_MEGSC
MTDDTKYDTPTRDELFRTKNQMTLGNMLSCVKAAGGIYNSFKTVRGFRQGDSVNDHESVQLSDIQHNQRKQTQPDIGMS